MEYIDRSTGHFSQGIMKGKQETCTFFQIQPTFHQQSKEEFTVMQKQYFGQRAVGQ